jgi:signal transduction histidine kinase
MASGQGASILTLELIHRLPLGVLIFDAAGTLISSNQAADRMLGHTFEQGLGMTGMVERLGTGCAALATLQPGGRQMVLSGGLLLEVESQAIGDGTVLWLVDDKSEELRLRSQLAEQASLLAHGSEAFLVVDAVGQVRYANAVCERFQRAQPGSMVGSRLADLQRLTTETYDQTQDPGRGSIDEHLATACKSDGPVRYNVFMRRSDGTEFPAEVSLRPYRMSQEQVLLVTIRDESRRIQHLQDLMEAKATAEAANRAKSAFMAITSHELRTPLTSIIGFCDLLLLEHGGRAGDLAQYLRLIAESSRSLLNIITDILDLSKIEAKTLEVRVEPVDPDRLLDLIAELWQPRIAAKNLTLVRHPTAGPSRSFYSDPLRLRQVLDNLISNAVKFTTAGSIELFLENHDGDLEFRVSDCGPGISPADQSQLFRPFWQLSDHRTRKEGGTGLGLYICRQITQLLGGTIWLSRSDERGATFAVRLPRNLEGQTGLHRVITDSVFRAPKT